MTAFHKTPRTHGLPASSLLMPATTLLLIVFTPLLALVGAATGFYFGGKLQ